MSALQYPISITPEIREQVDSGAVIAIGVSGGKDSSAVAIRLAEYLDEIGHTGPRVLIHSDLGRVEWKDSLPTCERLARRLGMEFMEVRRKAGDMMDCWLRRWENNVKRYQDLSCVRVILPWSTPALRFCTSQLKVDVITSALKKRFPDAKTILSVTGVRAAESASRAKQPICKLQAKLCRKGRGAKGASVGWDWHPIHSWSTEAVYAYLAEKGERLHEAYTDFGCTRVSCAFCMMASLHDLTAATTCADNHAIFREMVELEIASTFGYQGGRWLADVALHLLTPEMREQVMFAKVRAKLRAGAEARIPKHLLYSKGWPTGMPTREEAALLAEVRLEVADVLGLAVGYTSTDSIMNRYAELISLREAKQGLEEEEYQDAA